MIGLVLTVLFYLGCGLYQGIDIAKKAWVEYPQKLYMAQIIVGNMFLWPLCVLLEWHNSRK